MTVTELLSKITNVPANTISELADKVAVGDIDSLSKLNTLLSAEVLDKSDIFVASTDLLGASSVVINPGKLLVYRDLFNSNRTLTFSGSPTEGTKIVLIAEASAGITLTVPSSKRLGFVGTTTSIQLDEGWNELTWHYINGAWWLLDTVKRSYDADEIDDSSTTNKFVTATDVVKLANVPADTNTEIANLWDAINAINEIISTNDEFPYDIPLEFTSNNTKFEYKLDFKLTA